MQRRHLFGFFFVFLLIGPAWAGVFASASSTPISTFSTGSAEETVTITNGQHAVIGFDLERNTTIISSSFFIKPDSSGNSPGALSMDLDQDGLPEWSFNQTGYGDFGLQNVFTSGQATTSQFIAPNQANSGALISPDFNLPYGATMTDASIGIHFSPTLTGGFFPLGSIAATDKGDFNNDSNDDFVFLSTSNASTQGNGTAFNTASFDPQVGLHFSGWNPTCTNATDVFAGDINGDNYSDVIAYASSEDKLCIHYYNSTTMVFESSLNVTHSSNIIELDFLDMNGNGVDNLVAIRSGGKVSVDQFSNKTNSFGNLDELTVYQPGTTTAASLTHFFADHFSGTLNPPSLMVADQVNDGAQISWDATNGVLIRQTTNAISGIAPQTVVGDFDGDGDLDLVGPSSTGHRSIENRGPNGWDGDTHNSIYDFTNATILDHDYDMNASILFPLMGQSDGNSATIEGNLTALSFRSGNNYDNRISTSNSEVLLPWSAPRAIYSGDMDGDGIAEQIVLAGEGTQLGVFISAWHEIGYDVDQNGIPDIEAKGYSGNGTNGLSMLGIEDPFGNLTADLNTLSMGRTYSTDSYGIQMSNINFTMTSLTEGHFMYSNLSMTYISEFLVNTNPHLSGNLTNVLNQQMTAGTGTLLVPLLFNSTQDGSFVLANPSLITTPGAPNLALPPTPQLRLVDLQPDRVGIEWQNMSDFGDDLLNFLVYRANQTESVDLQNAYASSMTNQTVDFDVNPGEALTYWVRSVHSFGVTSNLSAPINVNVPYPLPPSYIPNVTATDRPNDDGGALEIRWDSGDASIEQHRVYVSEVNMTSIAGMTPTAMTNNSTFNITVSSSDSGQAIENGVAYYVAVVGEDGFGNFSESVTAIGPVYARNDTALETTIDVMYTDFSNGTVANTILLSTQSGLDAVAHLHHGGAGLADKTLTLHILSNQQTLELDAVTNSTGHAVFNIGKLADLGPIQAFGPMSLEVTYDGDEGDDLTQPLAAAEQRDDAFGTVETVLTPDTLIPLTNASTFETIVAVDARSSLQQNLLANMQISWVAVDANGTEVGNGTSEVKGNSLEISGMGAYGGLLHMYLDQANPEFYATNMMVSVPFEAAVVIVDNETNETNQTATPTFPETILAGTIDCGTATYAWENGTEDETITCTVSNPNPFDVLLGFSWKVYPTTPPPLTFEESSFGGDTPSVTIPANGSIQLEFTPIRNGPSDGLFPGIQGVGYVFYFTCLEYGTNLCDSMTLSSVSIEGELQWTLGEMPVTDNTSNDVVEDDPSSAMTPVLVGIGIVIFIAVAIGGVIFMRQRNDNFFEDDEDDDYYEEAMAVPDSRAEERIDLNSSRSLDELKNEGKELHEEAPEGLASSPALGSSADAFEFGATAEDAIPEPVEDDEEWAEDAEEESGISVDEQGTEWWEDEEGVWWYREEGWEDWAVWEE